MQLNRFVAALVVTLATGFVLAGQVPGASTAPHVPVSSKDRIYLSDQFSNTVSVVDPSTAKPIGVIKLGEQTPANLSPLYKGQLLVHGMGFSPDNQYGHVCSSFSPETVVVSIKTPQVVGRVPEPSPFCPDIAATPDGTQVWQTLQDIGKTQAFNAKPPFKAIAVLDTGPITNHVNIVRTPQGQFAYVTVGCVNEVKVFTTDDPPGW